MHTFTLKWFSSSPVWYVWWEFSQTAEFWWQSRASHGTHACSLSTPMPPPSTAVHSPSTSTQAQSRVTQSQVRAHWSVSLHGIPLVMCCQCDIIQMHLIFFISHPPSYAWVSRPGWNLLISLKGPSEAYGRLCSTRKLLGNIYVTLIKNVLAPSAGVE